MRDIQSSANYATTHIIQSMRNIHGCAITAPSKIQWNSFINGEIKFASAEAETEFRSLLNLDFGKQEEGKFADAHSGDKRKRPPENSSDASDRTDSSSTQERLLEAAHLARNGAVRAQHGAVIYVPSENAGETNDKTIIGRGWNHDYYLDKSKAKKNKLVLHSEVHAVADAIRNHGEDKCFEELSPRATIMITELESDYAYDTCHLYPK